MPVPLPGSFTLFALDEESLSVEISLAVNPDRRMIAADVVSFIEQPSGILFAYLWGEVRADNNNWLSFATVPFIQELRPTIVVPTEFSGAVWRVRYIPFENAPTGQGRLRFYTL